MMWRLIMDSPETIPWGLLHHKYVFWKTPMAFIIMEAAPYCSACY